MRQQLPPLAWILAFETAARHESFVQASDELGLTAGAVSRKVKALEEYLGRPLFERRARGVKLTEEGQNYAAELTPLLDDLQAATSHISRRTRGRRLTVHSLAALAGRWLVPRLADFQARHTDIAVEVSTGVRPVAMDRESIDVSLYYAEISQDDPDAPPFLNEDLFPVCSPRFAKAHRLEQPEDLFALPTLYDTHWKGDWPAWLAAAGCDPARPLTGNGFTLYNLAIDAAVGSQGVAMGHGVLVADDLKAGRLVAPFAIRVPAPGRYYVQTTSTARRRRHVNDFLQWLHEQASDSVESFQDA